jgi:hypothetical protein
MALDFSGYVFPAICCNLSAGSQVFSFLKKKRKGFPLQMLSIHLTPLK